MTEITSSGKQLYSLLKQAWDEDGNQYVRKIWTKVLGANYSNDADMSAKLEQFLELFKDVRDDINGLEISNREKYIKALDKIYLVLMNSPLLTAEWKNIKQHIAEETLHLIDACGDVILSQGKGLKEISAAELEDLQTQIKNLQDEILKSDIDKATKIFLINELRKIEEAILNYQIRTSHGLSKVVNEVTGEVVIHGLKIPERAKEFLVKVINIAIKTNSMISVGERLHKLPEIIEGIQHFLPSANNK